MNAILVDFYRPESLGGNPKKIIMGQGKEKEVKLLHFA